MKSPTVGLALLALALSACSKNEDRISPRVASAEKEIAALKAELEKARQETSQLANAVADALKKARSEFDSMKLETQANKWEQSAILSATDPGFAIARTNFGIFPVSVVGAEPYLDGQKLFLRIGNLTAADVHDAKVTITYARREPDFPLNELRGKTFEQNKPLLDEYEKNHKAWASSQKKLTPANVPTLPSGAWMNAEFIVSPAKPDELGYLVVKIESSRLALRE